ncbi:hypothetical protein MMC07_008269 [Pseudocyphellaria aurata]|nr:hypothetical protein [Pseudocyphellaria aurata]
MDTHETFLTSVMRGPNNEAQSFLEGILNPVVHYEDVIDSILGQLSNDDTNAMRCASRKTDNGLMARRGDGTLRHQQKTLRDKCDDSDVFGRDQLCPNGTNSWALLKRCSRGENERGFDLPKAICHRGIDGFLVCTTCDHKIRERFEHREMARFFHLAQRPVCAACAEKKEGQYPLGAQLCQCLTNFKRRVLCHQCVKSKVDYLCSNGKIDHASALFDFDFAGSWLQSYFLSPAPLAQRAEERAEAACAGCGVGVARWKDYRSGQNKTTLICTICKKYTVAPPTGQLRRSVRLKRSKP